ncbi:MAG TPA: hypothetical protein VJG85_00380 [Patescibacteria group bacterium]|nr:hypothetical protein [Patescibacteria group bacterium]
MERTRRVLFIFLILSLVLAACGTASAEESPKISSEARSVCYSFEKGLDLLGQKKGVRYNTEDAIRVCSETLTSWMDSFNNRELPSDEATTLTQYGQVDNTFQAAEEVRIALRNEGVIDNFIESWQGQIRDLLIEAITSAR